MMSVAREPERFRCAVSLNGVSDRSDGISEGLFLTRYIGRLWDPERLRALADQPSPTDTDAHAVGSFH